MAIALGGSFLPREGESFRISSNVGHFAGSTALSFNGAADLENGVYLTGGVGVSLNSGDVSGRVGVSIGW